MAAPIVETSTSTFTNHETITITKPSGTVEGDLLVALLGMADNVLTYPEVSGWTKINTIGAQNQRLQSYYKEAGGAEPANYSFTTTGEFNDKVGGIARISGQAASPADASANNSGSSTIPVAPAVTASEATDILRLRLAVSYSPELFMTTGLVFSAGDNLHAVMAEDAATTGTAVPTRNFDTYDFSDQWVTQTLVILSAPVGDPIHRGAAPIMMGSPF